ncbi:hypothetical protein [Shinella sp.]|uniref:hypothetical protein n=2 Tax=Hyphomicrobiales TaxID=356 RepID=UPI001BD008EF|nr:hypothetical protein [Shinella sp.]MBS7743593.1 hypothetical protein [Chelatococcus sp. HY11]MBX3546504.1 hypothetical protein [Chelatococcus sp.]CAH1662934.1 conserved exported hypothetical protein [Hyphomicrobiales bacterium]MCO5153839.1 hypothetical protein [Shinella sp.]CAH1687059.1 conserved exported hypothetical protein [Hyphomicrobiales bacterium]
MRSHMICLLAAAGLLAAGAAAAAEVAFTYKTSYRNVSQDPDKIWTGDALAAGSSGTVTIHEYELRTPRGDYLISQIWNDDCASATCPTRLVRVAPHQPPAILVDDMMHQIVPPDDPRFAGLSNSGPQAAFAEHPFLLSDDGKTLVNGDFKFEIGSVKP